MKQARILLLILFSLALVGCGNADDGALAQLKAQSISSAAQATSTVGSTLSYGPCKTMTVYSGTNASYASLYTNSQACASTSNLNVVKFKTTTRFPSYEEFCLVPLSLTYAYGETCFTTTGQVEITLTTDQFTAVTLVRKSDLSAYKAYLSGSSSSYPAMAYALLR